MSSFYENGLPPDSRVIPLVDQTDCEIEKAEYYDKCHDYLTLAVYVGENDGSIVERNTLPATNLPVIGLVVPAAAFDPVFEMNLRVISNVDAPLSEIEEKALAYILEIRKRFHTTKEPGLEQYIANYLHTDSHAEGDKYAWVERVLAGWVAIVFAERVKLEPDTVTLVHILNSIAPEVPKCDVNGVSVCARRDCLKCLKNLIERLSDGRTRLT